MVQPIHVSISQGRSGWCPFRSQWVPELSCFEQITTNLYFQFGGRLMRSICQTAQNAFSSSTPSISGWCKLFKSPFHGDSSSLAGRDHRADWKGLEVACGFVPWQLKSNEVDVVWGLGRSIDVRFLLLFFGGGSLYTSWTCSFVSIFWGKRMPQSFQ